MGDCCTVCCFALCTCTTWCCLNRATEEHHDRSLSRHARANSNRDANVCCPGLFLSIFLFVSLVTLSNQKHSQIHIPLLCPNRSCHHIGLLRILLFSSIPFWLFFLRARLYQCRRSSPIIVVGRDEEVNDERPPSMAPLYEPVLGDEDERPPPTAPHLVKPSAPVEDQPTSIEEGYGSIPGVTEEDVIPMPPPILPVDK